MPYQSVAQQRYMHINHPLIAERWDKEFPNQKGLPERVKMKKGNLNKEKALGITHYKENKGKLVADKIIIDVKAHKGDKAELASTIKHEIMHAQYPKKTEKEVYSATAKTKIPQTEQQKLLSLLGIKGETKPGDMINKMNEIKRSNISNNDNLPKQEVAIRGLI